MHKQQLHITLLFIIIGTMKRLKYKAFLNIAIHTFSKKRLGYFDCILQNKCLILKIPKNTKFLEESYHNPIIFNSIIQS